MGYPRRLSFDDRQDGETDAAMIERWRLERLARDAAEMYVAPYDSAVREYAQLKEYTG